MIPAWLDVSASLCKQYRSKLESRLNPAAGTPPCASHHPDSRSLPAVSRSMETNRRSLACPGPDPRHTSRMDQRPTTVQPTLRLSKISGRQAQRAPILPGHSAALPRHRLDPPSSRSVGHSGSVVRLLPGAKEGHRQDEGVHRPDHHQPVPKVRALQDGGPAHSSVPAPTAGSHVEGRHVGLLHAFADRGGAPLVLPISVLSYECTAMPFGLAPAPRIAT